MIDKKINLQDFCDMDKLYSILDNWSKSTGASAVVVDMEGNRTSESFGMTKMCQMIHDTKKGYELCAKTRKEDKKGVYICPMGFCDFSIPLVLPDGTMIGRVMAGQILSTDQDEQEILKKLMMLGLGEEQASYALAQVPKKTKNEIENAYRLLEQMLSFFVEKSYSSWVAQQQLEKTDIETQLEIAKKANEAKSLFLSNMSHDIRTPMNGIIGMTAIASAHIDDKERVRDCLGKIAGASRHLISLINDILDLSKIESGNITLSEDSFSISDLLDDLVNMLSAQLESKYLQFDLHVDHVVHEHVIGDSLKLQQVFMNILSNAIKYTPNGGNITVVLRERPTDSNKIAEFEFVCKDTGYGMSEEYLSKLFVPFERSEDARVKNIQGTGLGMVITRNIVRMMDGDITVESEIDQGSTFTVIFRMRHTGKDIVCDDVFKNLKVLIVDDDSEACQSICKMVTKLGMEGECAYSGLEAVSKVQKHHAKSDDYNVCLIDLHMPKMNGIETTRHIRQFVTPDDTHVMIVASDWSSVENEARSAGVNDFISKPLFKTKLLDKFRETILGEKKHDERTDELTEYLKKDYSDRRILLVEDNELNREIAYTILCETMAQVETAENGQIALDMVQNSEEGYYDMILMDIQMPVMNGLDATRAIRQLGRTDVKTVPIVAMSANAFSEDMIKSRNAGMNDHIAKPINLKKLLDIMEYYFESMESDSEKKKIRKKRLPSVVPARYYEELYFVDGTTTLSLENEKACIDVLNRNGAVGIFGLLEQTDFQIYCVSGFALTILGYTYGELMEASDGCFMNLVHPKDRQIVADAFYEQGHKHYYRLIGKGGKIIPVVSVTTDTYAADGKKIRMGSVRVNRADLIEE